MDGIGETRLTAFQMGQFKVEPTRNIIRAGDQSFSLEPRIMDVLSHLASRAGDVVTRETLISKIWEIEFGGDDSLSRAISVLRRTFREAGATSEVIETIPKRGYRLTLSVEPIGPIESVEPDTGFEPGVEASGAPSPKDHPSTASSQPVIRPDASLRTVIVALVGVVLAALAFLLLTRTPQDPAAERIVVSATVPTPERSLAVLPFADLSAEGDQSYFSDGVAEEILNVLVQLDGLYVTGRTSSFAFKSKDVGLREIGEALNVAFILEGSTQRQGGNVRVRVRLVEAASGYQVWSETFDRDAADIFAIQDEIARSIASELGIVLQGSADVPIANAGTTNPDAYDLVLKARAAYRKSPDAETFDQAEAWLNEAVTIDPDYIDAWIAIATLNNFASGFVGARSLQDGFEKSREAVARAYEIDPDSVLTTIWRANVSYFEGNLKEAYRLAEKAVALEPENAAIVFSFGHYNAIFGYTERAVPYLDRATRLDPLDGFAWHTRARISQNLGQFEQADTDARLAIQAGDYGAIDVLTWNAVEDGNMALAMKRHGDLFDAGAEVIDPGLGGRLFWFGAGRAIFERGPIEVRMFRDLLRREFNNSAFEPSVVSIEFAAKIGLYDAFYDQWRQTYAAKSLLAIAIWSNFEWARQLRQDDGFADFAEREGFVALWQAYGWPDVCQPNPGTDGSNGQFSCS